MAPYLQGEGYLADLVGQAGRGKGETWTVEGVQEIRERLFGQIATHLV